MADDAVLAIDRKFDEIYSDLEQNIIRIWGRRDTVIAIDLVYHSVLSFFFQEVFIQRGYLELLIVGDSGQAKTEVIKKMRSHYELGEILSGETASRTGLVYSIQENQRRRFLTWGALPLNDRKLLAIDEFSGVNPEEVENMSSLRATGIAEVNRSIKSKTASRTRLIFLSNTRDGRMLAEYQNGVESIDKLFTKKEDIRRLDFAVTVASGEVAESEINKKHKSTVEHKFLALDCRNLILWAWSRKPNQVIFPDETIDAILLLASSISKRFHANIPLVEPADMRIKLARLSAALAARLYSTVDGHKLIIQPQHVRWIYSFLCRIYSKPSMAYDLYSRNKYEEAIIKDEGAVRFLLSSYGVDFLKRLLYLKQIAIIDIDVLVNNRDKAKDLLTKLYLMNALKKVRTFYVHTSAFIILLKRMINELDPEAVLAPENKKVVVEAVVNQPGSTPIDNTPIDNSDYPEYHGREPGDESDDL